MKCKVTRNFLKFAIKLPYSGWNITLRTKACYLYTLYLSISIAAWTFSHFIKSRSDKKQNSVNLQDNNISNRHGFKVKKSTIYSTTTAQTIWENTTDMLFKMTKIELCGNPVIRLVVIVDDKNDSILSLYFISNTLLYICDTDNRQRFEIFVQSVNVFECRWKSSNSIQNRNLPNDIFSFNR